MKHFSGYAAIAAVLFALPAFAQDVDTAPPNPKWALMFQGGAACGGTGYEASANGCHALLGGGFYHFPFAKKSRAAAGLGFGFEIGRAVLATSETFDVGLGPSRLQYLIWPVTLGARYDLPRWKFIGASLYGAYVPSRETEVMQVPDPYSIRETWTNIETLGYQCPFCVSGWSSRYGVGASVAFVKPSKNYRGEPSGKGWAFPLRYMLYKPDKFTALTLGIEYKF